MGKRIITTENLEEDVKIENEESILWSSYICNNELILRFILLENEKCCGRSKGRR